MAQNEEFVSLLALDGTVYYTMYDVERLRILGLDTLKQLTCVSVYVFSTQSMCWHRQVCVVLPCCSVCQMYVHVHGSILHPSVPREGFIALSVCLCLIQKSEGFSIRYSSASAYILQASY